MRGDPLPVRVEHGHPAAEQLAQHGGDVVHAAAGEHDVGEPVVGLRCLLDGRVGVGELGERDGRLRGPSGLQERDGGQRGERPEQRHLGAVERAAGAVGGEEHPDELAVDQQRGATDRDQPLLLDGAVDLGRVRVALVGGVVGRPVRAAGLRHQAAQAGARRQPQLLEPRRHRARRRPHERVAAGGVGQGQVGDVGAEQAAGPPHDRVEDPARIVRRGEVAGRVDQRGQLGLPAPVRIDDRAGLQGQPAHVLGRAELPRPLVETVRGHVLGEQAQQLEGGTRPSSSQPSSQSARRTEPGRPPGRGGGSRRRSPRPRS